MRHSALVALSTASALFAAVSAFAASDYYLKLGDIKGESAEHAAQATLQVSAFSWGANQAGSSHTVSGGGKASMQDLSVTRAAAPRDAASGMPTGKRQHKPVMLTADGEGAADSAMRTVNVSIPAADSATTQSLDRACASGNHIESAELGGKGERYKLSDVVVSSCTVAGIERKYELRGHVTLMK
jgi:type VI protein secretion system component Hcp